MMMMRIGLNKVIKFNDPFISFLSSHIGLHLFHVKIQSLCCFINQERQEYYVMTLSLGRNVKGHPWSPQILFVNVCCMYNVVYIYTTSTSMSRLWLVVLQCVIGFGFTAPWAMILHYHVKIMTCVTMFDYSIKGEYIVGNHILKLL